MKVRKQSTGTRIRNTCIKNPTCVTCLQIIRILSYLHECDLQSRVYSCTAASIYFLLSRNWYSDLIFAKKKKNTFDWPWDKSGCHDTIDLRQKGSGSPPNWAAGCPGRASSSQIPSGWASHCPAGAPPRSLHMQKICSQDSNTHLTQNWAKNLQLTVNVCR